MKPINIPFPDKLLWPNGPRGNVHAVKSAKDKAKNWATIAAMEAGARRFVAENTPIPVRLIVYPKPSGPLPDRDNCVAAVKHSLDSIATVMGVNDRDFAAPTVEFGPRQSRIEVVIG